MSKIYEAVTVDEEVGCREVESSEHEETHTHHHLRLHSAKPLGLPPMTQHAPGTISSEGPLRSYLIVGSNILSSSLLMTVFVSQRKIQ